MPSNTPEIATLNSITIVIPVYGDLPTLERCLVSVLEHADEPWIEVLVVNDCGPDADAIEARILELIAGRPRIRYARNPHNLGFVRTCNRAVSELDTTDNDILLLNSDAELTAGAVAEMREVLALSPRHGAVCPRSNNATIATIPVLHSASGKPSAERSREVFQAVSPLLDRYYVSPVAVGFCLLIQRRVIRNHGLFDEVYGAGYNEENDFCMRINDVGYSSLIANRALVLHAASSSFGAERRARLDAENFEILEARYPFYNPAVAQFVRSAYSSDDRFADVLVPAGGDAPARVLIDVHHLSKHYDGTTKNVLSLLELLAANPPQGIDIAVAAYEDTTAYFRLRDYGMRVLDYNQIDEVFDLGITAVPITSVGQLATLTRHCARIVVSFLDAIALRTYRHVTQTPMKPTIVRAGLRWADRVVAISAGSLDDMADLYPGSLDDVRAHTTVITQGSGLKVGLDHSASTSTSTLDPRTRSAIDAGGYALVVGNGFGHKQVVPTLDAMAASGIPVVAMADRLIAARFPDVPIALSGTLTEAELDALYRGASVVISPSAYEGFGLSLAEAAQHGKRIVAFDTAIAREVVDRLDLAGVSFFQTFDQLVGTVEEALAAPSVDPIPVRTLSDYAADLWRTSLEVLAEPLDAERLRARDRELLPLVTVAEGALDTALRLLAQNTEILASRSFRVAQLLATVSGRARRLLRIRPRARTVDFDRRVIDQT